MGWEKPIIPFSHKFQKVGIIYGLFDSFHSDHVSVLEESKDSCDYLLVALKRKENSKTIQSVNERKKILSAIKFVDQIIVYDNDDDLSELIKFLNPKLVVDGVSDEKYDMSSLLFKNRILGEVELYSWQEIKKS